MNREDRRRRREERGRVEEDVSLTRRALMTRLVMDSLTLVCLMTSHIQGRLSISTCPRTPVDRDVITST